jgi:general stress protein 26
MKIITSTMRILNASPGFGVPLNEEEIKDFLTNGKLIVHLGTIDEKGDANIHPAWYYYDSSKNKIYIETSKQAKKTYNLRRNENIYFCIDDPNPPYKGVRGKGRVRIYEDINFKIPIVEKILIRYLGNLEHPMAQALLDAQRKGQSVVLEISPKYYSTWDYSKSAS